MVSAASGSDTIRPTFLKYGVLSLSHILWQMIKVFTDIKVDFWLHIASEDHTHLPDTIPVPLSRHFRTICISLPLSHLDWIKINGAVSFTTSSGIHCYLWWLPSVLLQAKLLYAPLYFTKQIRNHLVIQSIWLNGSYECLAGDDQTVIIMLFQPEICGF